MAGKEGTENKLFQAKQNPMETSNIFSRLFFCWTLPLFNYGYKKTLEITDLYQIMKTDSSRHLADKVIREWDKELQKEKQTGQKPSLFKALSRAFWSLLFLNGVLSFFEECVFKMGQPILMGILVQYFTVPASITKEQAYYCAVAFSICVAGSTVLHHPVFFISSRIGMRVRIAVCALIYRKALRLSNSALGKTTVGQLVNILSNDVNRFDLAFVFFHYLWMVPIQVVTMVIVLWYQMGPVCLVALITLLLVAPIQGMMGNMFSKLRAKTAILTDERVRIMNEVIAGMRIIKIHAWEPPFTSLVEDARREEIKRIQHSSSLRSFTLSFFFVSSKVVAFTTFVTFSVIGNLLHSGLIFLAIPLFEIMRVTACLAVPYCIQFSLEALVSVRRAQLKSTAFMGVSYCVSNFMEAAVSIKRTQNFLVMDELQSTESLLDGSLTNQNLALVPDDKHDDIARRSKGTFVNFDDDDDDDDVQSNSINGYIAQGYTYDDQDSNYQNLTKEHAAFGQETNKPIENCTENSTLEVRDLGGSWDCEVTQNRCLDAVSFSVSSNELVAVIGPVGSGKSSLFMALLGELPHSTGKISFTGQYAYTSQQPWVFTGTLRENVIFGRPYNKARYEEILSVCALKRDVAILSDGDMTLIGERGVTLSGGQRSRVSLARAVYDDADLYLLDDPLSAVDTAVGRHLFDRCIKSHLKDKPVILVTHQLQYLSSVDKIVVLKEGRMVDCGTYKELQRRGVDFAALLKEYKDEDHQEDSKPRSLSVGSRASDGSSPEDVAFDDDYSEVEDKETKQEGTIKGSVYFHYIMAGSGFITFIIFMFFNCTAQIFFVMADWWLSEWAFTEETCSLNYGEEACLNDPEVLGNVTSFRVDRVGRSFFIYIYATFLVLLLVFAFVRTLWLFQICVSASKNLHNRMFAAVIRTRMQFFDTNPVGRILNRFSKDIGFMDESLPVAMSDFNQIGLQTISFVITICIFNPIVIVFTAPLVVVFGFVRAYFLATSRDVKRIEGVCRSPIFSHLSSTLQGLTTVRAFRAQDRFIDKFDKYQDVHSEAWFAFMVVVRWFGIMLDWITAIFLIMVTFSAVFAKDLFGLDAAQVGLSLTYALGLVGTFQWGVRQSTEIENLMTSTERVIEYSNLEPEADWSSGDKRSPPSDWPQEGAVHFDDVNLQYSKEGPLVLKNISMKIAPREKIGIVGRTGAGKSSLTVALMRLVEPEGTITIDGIKLNELGLYDVRRNVSFIPQDPTLFSGTLRNNLDPFSEHSDDALWKVLKEGAIEESIEKLEMKVLEGGSNFSVGQRQLLCLARAMLLRNRVLLVDEATANVDIRTDQLIQATIRDKFRDCTVLTIAHRLNTIMDSDRVLVLDEGKIIEFDEPHILLQDAGGLFSKMVSETGSTESVKLIATARGKHAKVRASKD